MTDKTIYTKPMLIAMLSSMNVDEAASVIVQATMRDRTLPIKCCSSMMNLVATIASLMSAHDRLLVVNGLRDCADVLENELLKAK